MDFLRLAAYLKLDKSEYEEGLKDAENRAKGFGSKLASGFKSASKVIGAATVAGAVAVGKIASSAASAYADYEQLLGGVKKLYGTAGQSIEEYAASVGKSVADVKEEYNRLQDAQFTVIENADKAARTVGMSSNQYMETATQFSASLINSLKGDVQKAADLTDVAMRAMADNYNTFGSDMESVSNAFLGFSKQNYTMLDNLKLGYGGTKQEMARLIKDANAYAKTIGQAGDLSMDSFADIVTAIDLIQQKQNIAGTSAKEASTTITGSLNTIKAEWENLKVAMADGQGLDGYIKDLVEDVGQFARNIIPVFTQAIEGVGQLIEAIVPIISERLPGLVEEILPGLLSATSSLIDGVVKALPTLLQVLINELPKVLSSIWNTIKDVAPKVLDLVKDLINRVIKALPKAVEKIKTELPKILEAIRKMFKDFVNSLGNGTEIVGIVLDLIEFLANTLIDHAAEMMDAGFVLIEKLIDGIMENLPRIADTAFKIIEKLGTTIIEKLPEILEHGKEILLKLVQGITENIPKLVQAAVNVIKNLAKTLIDNLPEILKAGVQLILELAKGIFEALPELLAQIPQIIIDLVSALLDPGNIAKILDAGFQMIGSLFEGLFSGDFLGTAGDIIEALLGAVLAIPGLIMDIGAKIVGFILDGIKGAWNGLVDWVESGIESILGNVAEARDKVLQAQQEALEASGALEKYAENKANYAKYGTAQKSRIDQIESNLSMADRYRPKENSSSHYTDLYANVTVKVGNDTLDRSVQKSQVRNDDRGGGY